MKNKTLSLASFVLTTCLSFQALAQQPIKILFIGNSFTYYPSSSTNLPTQFKGMCTAAGKLVTTDMIANGGQYMDGSGGHSTSSATYAKIRSQKWDYVVLQDNQGYFAGYVNQLGSSTCAAANDRVRDSVYANNPCSRVIWFAGWGLLGGYPSGIPGDNTIKMNIRIDSNYQYLNNKYPNQKELIAPFGKTWNAAITASPSIESLLFGSDGNHPAATGQYSNAAVLYAMIFKQDPSNINYSVSGVSASNAALLRQSAWQTVNTPYLYNSHQMPASTPVITNNNGILSVSGTFTSYQWYLNNVAIAGATSSTYTPTGSGSYMVIATGSNNCSNSWSFPISVTATSVNENYNNAQIIVYPNPVTDLSVLSIREMKWEGAKLEILNTMGQIVRAEILTSDTYYLHRNDFAPGIYIYSLTDEEGNRCTGKINVK